MNEEKLIKIKMCIKQCKDRLILFAGKNKTLLKNGYDQEQADIDRKVINHFESLIKINERDKWNQNINIIILS